ILEIGELADVKRPIARDAALSGVAIACGRARLVTLLKRADERRRAIGVDGAPFGETGEAAVARACPHDEQTESQGNDELPELHGERRRTAMIHDDGAPCLVGQGGASAFSVSVARTRRL